jgi:hypothetical protein
LRLIGGKTSPQIVNRDSETRDFIDDDAPKDFVGKPVILVPQDIAIALICGQGTSGRNAFMSSGSARLASEMISIAR